jgi:hypothetical protein
MPERASVNLITQIGVESVHGTSVAAGKKLLNMGVVFTPKPDVKTYRPGGHRYITEAVLNREWTELKADGMLDYNDFVYIVSGPFGAANITTPGGGTNSRAWAWTPAITGNIDPKTFTLEQGDGVRAQKVVYGLFTGFNYKGSKDQGFTLSAPMIAQPFSDNITMTSSPTSVALAPVAGGQVNIWVDTTSGGLGGTQFLRVFTFEYNYDSGFAPFFALNRSVAGFTGHIDVVPKPTVKLSLEADSNGMSLYPHLQAGDYLYVRFDAQGPIIESTIHYSIVHDMAIKLTQVSDIKDANGGLVCTDYTGEIAEDPNWSGGQAQVLTVTNALTAL